MNPYEASPEKIPSSDRYATEPFYGRYSPRPDDFSPEQHHINSSSDDSLKYWASVLKLCDASVRIYENIDGGRDVFALGSVIVKSSHLRESLKGRRADRDYSFADRNEIEAINLARKTLDNVKVPKIYFAGKINGRDVLVQQRIPGVGLNIAWQYISSAQKVSFKQQAREVLRQLNRVKPPHALESRSYLVPDPDPVAHRGIQEQERDIIFSKDNNDVNLSFMHNDFSLSNTIVDHDKIVGLIDWEMAGYFGWETAGRVHIQIRSPKRENYTALNLPQNLLDDILFWNDLYDYSST